MNSKKIKQQRQRRKLRVRNNLNVKTMRPRVSVFRSHQNIYAQVIDDAAQTTIVALSSQELTTDAQSNKLDKTALARMVGVQLAKQALQANIKEVVFDRGAYLYHGRVKALADGLRDGGLQL